MSPRLARASVAAALGLAAIGVAWFFTRPVWSLSLEVRPNLEERSDDGAPWSPATQSFVRGRHGLEGVRRVELRGERGLLGTLRALGADGAELLRIVRLPLSTLVPRLRYVTPAFDDFDAFNLMLAEFSRNGQSVPWGRPGDALAHFESAAFSSETPYTLRGDYDFVPDPTSRPLRVALVNNCLEPGLFELQAQDRVGEMWHAWLGLPAAQYVELAARANGLDVAQTQRALAWSTRPVALGLERLRTPLGPAESVAVELAGLDQPAGYSTQDSRQKLGRGFAEVLRPAGPTRPTLLGDLTAFPARLVAFVPPGLYARHERRTFDLAWLRTVRTASVGRVTPLTRYDPRAGGTPAQAATAHLELRLTFDGGRALLLGNLPLGLLGEQEDFVLYGFGVGVLPPESPAERTQLLMTRGPAPSFAYLTETQAGVERALNSHALGLEQVFVRSHPFATPPQLELVLSSYERITDLVRYRVMLPASLHAAAQAAARDYVSPAYFTYRDDNTR